MKIVLILLALITLPTSAMAQQQRTVYGADGKPIGREATDSQGTRTLYGSDGRAISRESKGTIYGAESGRAVGKITRDKR